MDNLDIRPPTLQESKTAFWVASYAQEVAESLIENGRPNGRAFMQLCAAIEELSGKTIGALPFHERAEEIFQLMTQEEKQNG